MTEPTPISKLLGDPSEPPRCKVFTADIAMHWFAAGAKPGDPCLCGATTKKSDDD